MDADEDVEEADGSPVLDDLALVGTRWRLVRIDDEGVSDARREPFLLFSEDGRVTGTSGVNRLTSTYEVVGSDDEVVQFGAVATTRMAGPSEAMSLEHRFLAALGQGGSIAIDGDVLTLGPLTFAGEPVSPDA